jgi:hypothetical protein
MKKLLLLLILSFFSVQSFAGSCPDGSDPVKSISVDGTYFVYNCGGKTNAFDGEYGLTGRRSLSTTSWGYSIVSDIVRAGKESQRFEVRPGDCGEDPGKWSDCDNNRERSEISLDRKFLPGDNQWIGFSLYIPEHYQTSNYVATTLGQIHQSGGNRPTGTAGGFKSYPPVLQLEAKGGYYDACIHLLSGSGSDVKDICDYFRLSRISDMRGRWTDIEIHLDTTDKKSLVEIYVNKERKALREDFIEFWPESFYVKYGIYRSFVSRHGGPMPTQIVWFDEIKMGNTREEIAINEAKPVYVYSERKESSDAFDGRYSFTISRYKENEGSKRLGNGYIEINNGIMTVAKDGRTLRTGSIDLYDSFEGQIDKQGNIISLLKIDVLTSKTRLNLVDLTGSIDTQLQGEWDDYFDVILKLGEKE